MISIDTYRQIQTAKQMKHACNQIDQATMKLLQVRQHNDWNCKNRAEINQNIAICQNKIKQIDEKATAFSDSMSRAATELDNLEKILINHVGNLDGYISSITTIIGPATIKPIDIKSIISKLPTTKVKWLVCVADEIRKMNYNQIIK